jgi:hypothetical protein
MTLLKNDGSVSEKLYKVSIVNQPDGVGLNVKDGWQFGIGFGLAMTVAVPFILLMFGLFVLVIFAIFGSIG